MGKLNVGPWGHNYSLHNVKSRAAKLGDLLTTRKFNNSTRGFPAAEDMSTAVCLLPGTELAFADEVRRIRSFEWESYPRREPKPARERLGPLKPRKPVAKGAD